MLNPTPSEQLIRQLGIDVLWAQSVIIPKIHRTSVRRLRWLESIVGVPVWAKLENHQLTGSFKIRGAFARVAHLQSGTTVIAASAGNHGLGIATAASWRGMVANICVPISASRLKRERILAGGVGLIVHGGTVEESAHHARSLAELNGWVYVSPFNDPDVIAGQGTLFLEFLEQCPDLKMLVVPIGGGGLISGAVAARCVTGQAISIIGCEPEAYASMHESISNGQIHNVIRQPTFADGLAVNLESDSITFDIVRTGVDSILCLPEEEIAAGTAALLIHESLLVEPAGAASIFTLLRLHALGKLTGPVGIPLCGGNIDYTTLLRIAAFPYESEVCLRLLNLRGRRVTDIPSQRVVGTPVFANQCEQQEQRSYTNDLTEMFSHKTKELEGIRAQLSTYKTYCDTQALVVPNTALALLQSISGQVSNFLEQSQAELETGLQATIAGELNIRTASQLIAAASTALEWCSPSYSQALAPQFFDVSSQESKDVNYERYGYSDCSRIEEQLLRILQVPPDRYTVTVTSSGMAAYSLIEAFLLRHRLLQNAAVLLSPYIYFEAAEQLTSLKGLRVVNSTSYASHELAEQATLLDAAVIFADPLANHTAQRMVDVWDLLSRIDSTNSDTTLVVDGSMLPAAFASALCNFRRSDQILYYESCSKYLQYGQDMSMAGVVVHAVELKPVMDRLRRNLGAILTRHGSRLFPNYEPLQFFDRVRRIETGATTLATILSENPTVYGQTDVIHPSLARHPDFDLGKRIGRVGGCITFRLHKPGNNQRGLLEVLIDHILTCARREGVGLVKGVSFGFSIPRIAATSAMAENDPPFLRLAAGDYTPTEVERLARVIIEGFESFSKSRLC